MVVSMEIFFSTVSSVVVKFAALLHFANRGYIRGNVSMIAFEPSGEIKVC